MKRTKFVIFLIGAMALGFMVSMPVAAQESIPETIPISGSLDYVPTLLLMEDVGGTTFWDVLEDEVWMGDIAGTASGNDRIMTWASGESEAWITFEIDATVLGEYEGTLNIISVWKKKGPTDYWHGEWTIMSGTDDLEHIHGFGVGWGPGFNREDPEASPDIYYTGEIVFLEPVTD